MIFLTVGSNTKFQYFLARFPDSELVLIFFSLSYFFFHLNVTHDTNCTQLTQVICMIVRQNPN